MRASGQVLFALGYVAAVLLVVRDAIAGQRSIGGIVLVIALATQVNQQVNDGRHAAAGPAGTRPLSVSASVPGNRVQVR